MWDDILLIERNAYLRDGNHLFAQAANQPKFELFAESRKDFFFKEVEAQVTFELDMAGRATGLTLHQNGAHLPGKRME